MRLGGASGGTEAVTHSEIVEDRIVGITGDCLKILHTPSYAMLAYNR